MSEQAQDIAEAQRAFDEQAGSIDTIDTDEYLINESVGMVKKMEPEALQPWEDPVELPSSNLDELKEFVGRID